MNSKVFVTGAGIISAIGNNIEGSIASLKSGKSGITSLDYIETIHKDNYVFGEVKFNNNDLKILAGIPVESKFSRTSLLGIIAAKEAIKNSNITDINEFKTGIVSATSVGGMSITENYYADYLDLEKPCDLDYIDIYEFGDSTEKIADSLGIREYMSTISTACSSSANSIMFGARLIKQGILDRVVVGGTDSLSRFTINGFISLNILDKHLCKPYDSERKGLNLGEGAGFLVLESERVSKDKDIICELTGYGNSNDAYHQTASSPEGAGAFLAMQKAFQISKLNPTEIDYINAHGTGTEVNDLSEGIALDRIFNKNVPRLSSTKAFTGHTLGACGGIEAIFSVLAIKHNMVFQSLNYSNKMPELSFTPIADFTDKLSINNVLSNSFGFGGNTSSLIFSRYK